MSIFDLLLVLALGFLHSASDRLVRADNCPNPGNVMNNNTCIDYKTTIDMLVTFKLYNSNFPNGTRVAPNDTDDKLRSAFIKDIDIKIITHGWLDSENRSSVVKIREAYVSRGNLNVVSVGWSPISRSEYIITTFRVPQVGIVIGNLVNRLLRLGLTTLKRVHMIGHSLGAHVVGIAGGFVRDSGCGKVGRITGLDPAKPFFENVRPWSTRLDLDDGEFVDIIHTNINALGYTHPLGHADFYPNGGFAQPGCFILDVICSHTSAYWYFAESIYNKKAFPSVQCDSYTSFLANRCECQQIVYMGDPTPVSTRGTFYLRTNFTRNITSLFA